VPPLLAHHRLKRIDQLGREEARILGDLEQAEAEKAVDAFGIARAHEGEFRIPRAFIFRLGRKLDAISPDHVSEHELVA